MSAPERGLINRSTMEAIAEETKKLAGITDNLTPAEIVEALREKNQETLTYILCDEEGNEAVAVLVEEEAIFTATENDIREGTVAATAEGVTTGTKVIPAFHTTEGKRLIQSGSTFEISFKDDLYDFTKFQAIICLFSGDMSKSVASEKVAIDEGVYATNSTEILAVVTRDSENKAINLGITNESENLYVLRYFTYKEIY